MPDPDFQRFAREGCPDAFRRLVERHLDMAHSTARRVLGRRADLAEDVSQQVFLLLARKAATLPEGISVGAWLHRQTVRRALNTVRSETRRERRELRFEEDAAALAAGEENGKWPELAAQLDQALLRLPETDRQAVILRFMHRMPPEKLGSSLGVSAAAALKRASRALESLRLILRRRGVEIPAAALGTLLTRNSAEAAPAWVAEQIITQAPAAIAASGSAAAAAGNLTTFLVMTHAKAPALTLVLIALLSAGGGWWAAGDTPAASGGGSAEAAEGPAFHSPAPASVEGSWLARIGMARAEDFVALAEEARREPNPAVREERLGDVFSRWVEVAPRDGWAWVNAAFPGKRESGGSRPPDTRLAFLLHWTAVDGPSAYAAERGSVRVFSAQWESEIALKWSRIDARGLLDFIESGRWDKEGRAGATVYALRALAREDPLPVYEKCLKLGRDDRDSVISVVAESLGAKDPEATLEWARRLSSEGEARELAYYGIFGALSQSEPDRAAEMMEKALPEDLEDVKKRVADPLLQRWMSVDPAAATRWALRQGPQYAGSLWRLIPPGTSGAYAVRQSLPPEERSQWDSRQSGNWTAAAAGEWLERHPAPSTEMETATARTGVMALVREDVSAAARWVDQLPDGPLRNDLRNVLLAGMAETGANPSLIMDQLARLTEVPDDDAPRRMVARLAAERPAEILEKISALPAGGGKRDTWLAETAAAWAELDPSAASSWTDTIPSTETRAKILGQVLAGWWPEDPEAAEAWAATQPPGILRDTAAARIAEGLTQEAPDEAFNWALDISDGKLRAERLAPAYRNWAAMDPEDAAEALAESALTDAEKAHITDFAAKPRRGPFQD